ncbi:MAG: hypothetical protein ACE14L_08540 [Terriglobales bacterium]
MSRAPWELGSEFHWQGLPAGPFVRLPGPANYYLLGRHALLALLDQLRAPVLWVPEYFCTDVLASCARRVEIRRYDDSPSRACPRWESLTPTPDDVVLAVNYFGIRDHTCWNEWHAGYPCVLVEDHSHDPLGPSAAKSRADYCFSSLRKTLPVPDGGILWSPLGRPLPLEPSGCPGTGSAKKLTAMLLKAEYLSGSASPQLKERFRRLQLEGEAGLEQVEMAAASPFTREMLRDGVPRRWRKQREENTRFLLKALAGWHAAKPLFTKWPNRAAPLGLVVVFSSPSARDETRRRLCAENVYCPVHWPAPADAPEHVRDLAARILTVPADQRYTTADMQRVARLLRGGRKLKR